MTSRRPSRKQARRDALFVLYQREVTNLSLADLLANLRRREGYVPDEFTVTAVNGVIAAQAEIDARLEAQSRHWPLQRIAPLERSVLRLALWEMRGGETPPEVAIDEAVRLAKRYSTDEAGSLVNGILGGIAGADASKGVADDGQA
jgi:transcription antitermination protein NusB